MEKIAAEKRQEYSKVARDRYRTTTVLHHQIPWCCVISSTTALSVIQSVLVSALVLYCFHVFIINVYM